MRGHELYTLNILAFRARLVALIGLQGFGMFWGGIWGPGLLR